jgi:hypothetical protein
VLQLSLLEKLGPEGLGFENICIYIMSNRGDEPKSKHGVDPCFTLTLRA